MTISTLGLGDIPPSWPLAPSETRLGEGEIHVWCASLNDFDDDLSRFDPVLSEDERMRARKFHAAKDRERFIAGRGILRELLARYLHQDPATIELSYGRFGKPLIPGTDAHRPLHFNASHSGALAVYAVTWACQVGVDVEQLREIPDFEAIASRFFAPAEASRLTALPPEQRLEEFFACWTSKEAFVKATGEGLSAEALAEAGIGPHRGTCLSPDWRLQRLWPAAGYVGAVAYRHDAVSLSLWSVSNASLAH